MEIHKNNSFTSVITMAAIISPSKTPFTVQVLTPPVAGVGQYVFQILCDVHV